MTSEPVSTLSQENSYPPADEWLFSSSMNSYPSGVRWLFFSGQIAIRLPSDSHRTPKAPFSLSPSLDRNLPFRPLSTRRISFFTESHILQIQVYQQYIQFQTVKNRVFSPKNFFGRKYAILARRIYSLTKCQNCFYKYLFISFFIFKSF